MPGVPPGTTIAPGIVTDQNKFPQYGVGGGKPGSAAGWKIVTANNKNQKLSYENQGFLVWFDSRSSAQAFISSESSLLGSGGAGLVSNPLDFLRNIAAFFDKLGQASTWLRIGEFIIGAGLIIVGLARLASGTAVGKAAVRAGKAAAIL